MYYVIVIVNNMYIVVALYKHNNLLIKRLFKQL
jgi:hypothetical protein